MLEFHDMLYNHILYMFDKPHNQPLYMLVEADYEKHNHDLMLVKLYPL